MNRKNEIHYLNEQLHNVNSLKHVKPPRVYFRDGTSSFMGGGHTNRSKSTAIFESNEKIERPDDFLMGENERLRHILEEKERIIQELRVFFLNNR